MSNNIYPIDVLGRPHLMDADAHKVCEEMDWRPDGRQHTMGKLVPPRREEREEGSNEQFGDGNSPSPSDL